MNNNVARRLAQGSFAPIINHLSLILLAAFLLLCIGTGASGATRYVDVNNPAPAAPYTDWSTAATNIQDAVDAAVDGETVLVTNGVYQTGSRVVFGSMTNRLAVTKPLTVQSVNGPDVTLILGYKMPGTKNGNDAIRCVYLTNHAVISGFTLTNGATRTTGDIANEQSGGGVLCESTNACVTNCVLAGNSAYYAGGGAARGLVNNCTLTGNSASFGGGAHGGTLNNCILTGNSASQDGGGFDGTTVDTLNNCTLINNVSGFDGGGVATSGALNNCIIYYNTNNGPSQESTANFDGIPQMRNCCTTPLSFTILNPSANFTNAPLFVNQVAGDVHLSGTSPCINAGSNSFAPPGPDFDGHPRISGGTVDVGAYEFQNPASLVSYVWLAQYNLPNDGSADFTDADGDGMNNWQEWGAGTVPTDANSSLKISPLKITAANVTITFRSVPNYRYYLQRSTNLADPNSFVTIQTDTQGFPVGNHSFFDTNSPDSGPVFYRVGVIGLQRN